MNINSLTILGNLTISGSLTVTGSITGSIISSSYALTSSYSNFALISATSTATSSLSSSFASSSISSSYTLTASYSLKPEFGPTLNVGWLNPNITHGNYNGSADSSFLGGAVAGGLFFSPIEITKTCTVTTMSAVIGGNGVQQTSLKVALYTNNPTNNLPGLLLTQSNTPPIVTSSFYVANVSLSTPIQLNKGNVYWVGMAISGSGTRLPYMNTNNPSGSVYNPLLGYRLIGGSGTNAIWVQWCIRSGSISPLPFNFPLTCSQVASTYNTGSGNTFRNQIPFPFLKIIY